MEAKMTGYLVTIRKHHTDIDLPYKRVNTLGAAEDLANQLYKDMFLDRVMVVELNTEGRVHAERISLQYKRTRICNRRNLQIQGEFNFKDRKVEMKCMDCGVRVDEFEIEVENLCREIMII